MLIDQIESWLNRRRAGAGASSLGVLLGPGAAGLCTCVDPQRAGAVVYSTKNISCMLRYSMRALHHAMMRSHATRYTTII